MKIVAIFAAAIVAGAIVTAPIGSLAQRNDQKDKGGSGGGQSRPSAPPQQHNPAPSRPPSQPAQRSNPTPVQHAQREGVRTPNFVPRNPSVPTPGRQQPPRNDQGHVDVRQPSHETQRRQIIPSAPAIQQQRKFTKSPTGRVYDNGLRLRKGIAVTTSWQRQYFPKGHYHFPEYRNTYVRGQCYASPFGFFFGVCVPYIGSSECRFFPPSTVFIDIPYFNGSLCAGYTDAAEENLFNDPSLNQEQPGLLNAIDNLTEAFQGGNIDGLVSLIDPSNNIAVYVNGSYQYSLPANDYVDISRDAIQSMHTIKFALTYLHQRAPGVFSVAGKHTYQDQNGRTQATWESFVLQDISGQWTLTQVGTAPGVKR